MIDVGSVACNRAQSSALSWIALCLIRILCLTSQRVTSIISPLPIRHPHCRSISMHIVNGTKSLSPEILSPCHPLSCSTPPSLLSITPREGKRGDVDWPIVSPQSPLVPGPPSDTFLTGALLWRQTYGGSVLQSEMWMAIEKK